MSLALDPSFSHAPGPDLLGKLSRAVGAALALGITAVHVVDQGGLIGDKGPRYVGVGYWLLELAGIAVAVLLLSGRLQRPTWLLAAGVGAGPMLGYVLSRGPGMPGYVDDRGNWTEPIGLISLGLEAALILLAAAMLARRAQVAASPVPAGADAAH